MAEAKEKPIVVVTAFSAAGHSHPMIQIAGALVKRGFQVYFIGGSEFHAAVKRAGAEFVENTHNWQKLDKLPELAAVASSEGTAFAFAHFFLPAIPTSLDLLRTCLEKVREQHPARQVVILNESFFFGLAPLYHGAPLPKGYDKLPRVATFHTSVNTMESVDVFPFTTDLPPAANDEDRARIKALLAADVPRGRQIAGLTNTALKAAGATEEVQGSIWNYVMQQGDVVMLPYSASLDYPRSDLSPKLRFIGSLPLKPVDPSLALPSWWADVQGNAALPAASPGRKKVVFVSQGTTKRDYNELLVPTIRALAGRSDVIVVATLGSRGGALPEDVAVPPNTRIVDYLSYDVVLQHADVFVSNAGFGGFAHGIMNGVPMVLAGEGADKGEVCGRAAYSGIAISMQTGKPTVEALATAIDEVLSHPKYKKRALELQQENVALDAMGGIEKAIMELVE